MGFGLHRLRLAWASACICIGWFGLWLALAPVSLGFGLHRHRLVWAVACTGTGWLGFGLHRHRLVWAVACTGVGWFGLLLALGLVWALACTQQLVRASVCIGIGWFELRFTSFRCFVASASVGIALGLAQVSVGHPTPGQKSEGERRANRNIKGR